MSRNIVVITRGDTCDIRLDIGEWMHRHLGRDVSFYFGIMKPHEPFETATVRRKYGLTDTQPDTVCHTRILKVHLDADTTFALEPGVYYYALKAKAGDTVDTLVKRTKFVVNPS